MEVNIHNFPTICPIGPPFEPGYCRQSRARVNTHFWCLYLLCHTQLFCNFLCLTKHFSNFLCLTRQICNLLCLTQPFCNFLCLTQYFCNLVFRSASSFGDRCVRALSRVSHTTAIIIYWDLRSGYLCCLGVLYNISCVSRLHCCWCIGCGCLPLLCVRSSIIIFGVNHGQDL